MTDREFSTELLERIAARMSESDVELILCDDEYIEELNGRYRDVHKPTDVLSFPLRVETEGAPLGSIIISLDTAERIAQNFGHSPAEETALLFIHGMLHLLGYDHECDDGEMRREERRYIELFGLPESLIVRTTRQEEER